MIKIFGV
jgi:ubiquitin-conjugating enzyme E2 M